MCRDYETRIGGNDEIPASAAETCPPVELFRFKHGPLDLGWFPVLVISTADFPHAALERFLKTRFQTKRDAFLSLIGQVDTRTALIEKVFAHAVGELEKAGTPWKCSEYNLLFVGPPGTGKTNAGSHGSFILPLSRHDHDRLLSYSERT